MAPIGYPKQDIYIWDQWFKNKKLPNDCCFLVLELQVVSCQCVRIWQVLLEYSGAGFCRHEQK